MEIKDSTEQPITKSVLNKIHQHQLVNNAPSNNVQKEAIIVALGGIDQIVSNLLESNAILNDKSLFSLYNIITNTHYYTQATTIIKTNSANIEDKGYKKTLTFRFNDKDILLYNICMFNKKIATNIINLLHNKITKIVLTMIFFHNGILTVFLLLHMVSQQIWDIDSSLLFFVFFIYCFGWILTANIKAMKMLLKEFEFWFKLVYLMLHLTASTIMLYITNQPIYYSCTNFLFQFAFLFLVMIFDAINIKQSNQILISSIAVGNFAVNALGWSLNVFYSDTYNTYDQATVTIPNLFGVGSMKFNLIDITANSGQILVIFLLKQMISSIRKPKQASIIITKPFIIYEDKIENISTIKTIKNWKRITIIFWVFLLLVVCIRLILFGSDINRIMFFIVLLWLTIITLCLSLSSKIKFLWITNTLILVSIIIYFVAIFLFKWPAVFCFVWLIFIGFGLSVTYTLKLSAFEEIKLGSIINQQLQPKSTKPENCGNNNDQSAEEPEIKLEICEDETKESTEQQNIKSLLRTIHDHHQLNNAQKEIIVVALGGIDQIVSNLLESNAILNKTQLVSLHNIITKPYHYAQTATKINKTNCTNIEDSGYKQILKFTFNDKDMFLSQTTVKNIVNILNNKITNIVLVIIFIIIVIISVLLQSNIVSLDVWNVYCSLFFCVCFIYCIGWIITSNIEAMKLLLKEFEFWFKLVYLTLFLIAHSISNYIQSVPIHWICTNCLFEFGFVFLVIIFDAIYMEQSKKIIISSIAVANFAFNALFWLRIVFYSDEYDIYVQSIFRIPDFFGVGSMKLNIIDIAANSAQILALFLLKKLISSIRKPKQASIIIRKPFMIYEDQIENIPTIKTIKNWKRITIIFWIFFLLIGLFGVIGSLGLGVLPINSWDVYLELLFIFSILCLFMSNKIKFLLIANILIFVDIIIYFIAVFLLKWPVALLMVIFIGFGLSASYTLKFSTFEEAKLTKPKEVKNQNVLNHQDMKINDLSQQINTEINAQKAKILDNPTGNVSDSYSNSKDANSSDADSVYEKNNELNQQNKDQQPCKSIVNVQIEMIYENNE